MNRHFQSPSETLRTPPLILQSVDRMAEIAKLSDFEDTRGKGLGVEPYDLPICGSAPAPPNAQCRLCTLEKMLTDFPLYLRSPNRRSYYCRDCHNLMKRARRRGDDIRVIDADRVLRRTQGLKRCARCKATKPLDSFSKNKTNWDGLHSECKKCNHLNHLEHKEERKAKAKERRLRNPEKGRLLSREWQRTHWKRSLEAKRQWRRRNPEKWRAIKRRRRAREANATGSFTSEEWAALKRLYSYCCLRCEKLEPSITLEPDHIVPLSKGGSHSKENIQPLCRSCNAWKGTRTIDFRSKVIAYATN